MNVVEFGPKLLKKNVKLCFPIRDKYSTSIEFWQRGVCVCACVRCASNGPGVGRDGQGRSGEMKNFGFAHKEVDLVDAIGICTTTNPSTTKNLATQLLLCSRRTHAAPRKEGGEC